jgi:hypothetical protein
VKKDFLLRIKGTTKKRLKDFSFQYLGILKCSNDILKTTGRNYTSLPEYWSAIVQKKKLKTGEKVFGTWE